MITSLKENLVSLLIDGVLVKEWRNSGGMLSPGPGIAFSAEGKVKIADISISSWEADAVPAQQAPGKEGAAASSDTVTLANKDIISGSFEAVRDGNVLLKMDVGPLTLPLDRVASIDFAAPRLQKPRKFPDDVRVILSNRCVLTGRFEGVIDGKLVCLSEGFGEARIDLAAVRSVAFNIYVNKYFPERKLEDAW